MRTDPLLGRLIDGKYRIDAEIGAGGMAAIYRATRLHIGDVVAVKVLHSQLLREPQFTERFRREAQAAAQLKHPNVVAIYDFGVSEDGVAYLVMELVEGLNLRTIINDAGPLPAALAAEIVRQVCAALAEAHRQNIVHRDIKPANIAVETVPDGQRVKVLDFGIVSIREATGATNFTQTGAVLGTPAYMSPEQCLGEELDGRSDLYSLGVVLYEMLCGVVPFNSPTPTAVAIQHVQQAPPPLRVINASISPAVEDVVLRALAKRRDDRFRSVRDFADALSAAVSRPRMSFAADTVDVPLRPNELESTLVQPVLRPPIRGARPRKTPLIRIAIGAAAALAVGGVWLGLNHIPTPARHASVAAKSAVPRVVPRPAAIGRSSPIQAPRGSSRHPTVSNRHPATAAAVPSVGRQPAHAPPTAAARNIVTRRPHTAPPRPIIAAVPVVAQAPQTVRPRAETIAFRPGSDRVQDIWTTSTYSYAPGGGGPGGGLADGALRVGGWGDLYYTLLRFDLAGLPRTARSAVLRLYDGDANGGSPVGIVVYRIAAPWDWTVHGTGSDRNRLWWADQPAVVQWGGPLPAPTAESFYDIDITELYNAWQSGRLPNYGIELRPTANSNNFDVFKSSRSSESAKRPQLLITGDAGRVRRRSGSMRGLG
jgi:serine/threonine protein kinase